MPFTCGRLSYLSRLRTENVETLKEEHFFGRQSHGKKWQRVLTNEREIRNRMEDMVEQLARQHSHLEAMVRKEYAEHHHAEGSAPPVGSVGVSSHHAMSDVPERAHARSPTSNSTW